MKRIFVVCMLMILAFGCEKPKQINIDIDNLKNEEVYIKYRILDSTASESFVDTVYSKNGKFAYNIKHNANVAITFTPKSSLIKIGNNKAEYLIEGLITLYLKPQEKIDIKGYKSGTSIYYKTLTEGINKDKADFQKTANPIWSKISKLHIKKLSSINDTEKKDINTELSIAEDEKKKLYYNYIKDNSDKEFSAILLASITRWKEFFELYKIIPEQNKQGFAKYFLDQVYGEHELNKIKETAKNKIVVGKYAPNFTLKNIEGKDISLKKLRGKNIVLVFWGDWCKWCNLGMKDMVESYDKVKKRIEFVGINCGDSKQTWKNAIKKNNLTWTNLINDPEKDLTIQYGITSYPTKIILDWRGKILYVGVGESPAFYQKVTDLFRGRKI